MFLIFSKNQYFSWLIFSSTYFSYLINFHCYLSIFLFCTFLILGGHLGSNYLGSVVPETKQL